MNRYVGVLVAILLATTFVAACGDDEDSTDVASDVVLVVIPTGDKDACLAGGFTWVEDEFCSYPEITNCGTNSFCVKECQTDADCANTDHPYCRDRGLTAGGDSDCNDTMQACSSEDHDDCDQYPG